MLFLNGFSVQAPGNSLSPAVASPPRRMEIPKEVVTQSIGRRTETVNRSTIYGAGKEGKEINNGSYWYLVLGEERPRYKGAGGRDSDPGRLETPEIRKEVGEVLRKSLGSLVGCREGREDCRLLPCKSAG